MFRRNLFRFSWDFFFMFGIRFVEWNRLSKLAHENNWKYSVSNHSTISEYLINLSSCQHHLNQHHRAPVPKQFVNFRQWGAINSNRVVITLHHRPRTAYTVRSDTTLTGTLSKLITNYTLTRPHWQACCISPIRHWLTVRWWHTQMDWISCRELHCRRRVGSFKSQEQVFCFCNQSTFRIIFNRK